MTNSKIIKITEITYVEIFCDLSDLVVVVCPCQQGEAVRVELPTAGVQLGSVLFRQFRAEWIDRYDEGSSVCFKLK